MKFQVNRDHKILRNKAFETTANDLKPQLFEEIKKPKQIVTIRKNTDKIHGWEAVPESDITKLTELSFGKGEKVTLDFGDHIVGYLSLAVNPVGSPPDAPLHIRFKFGEMPVEIGESSSSYDGWISSSWIQEEVFHIDKLPTVFKLERRYSFRYLEIEVLNTSPKYTVSFEDIRVRAVTSADDKELSFYSYDDEELEAIDRVSIKTLKNCMHDVFEDGPKRDRRLWLGDLRLQAQANYKSYKNNNLVKKNLYEFAAVTNQYGQVSANLFTHFKLIPDDTYLFDYSLFFSTTLYDYYKETSDKETLLDLWPTALKQVDIALERLSDDSVVKDDETWWSFIDWNDDLNKQASSQAILIYSIKKVIKLAEELGEETITQNLNQVLDQVVTAAIVSFWDNEKGFFTSGSNKQVSWASQIWMVLAGVFDQEENKKLLEHLLIEQPDVELNTPYMYHHLVEALFQSDLYDLAIEWIKKYWGGMLREGADTFWELYNPNNPNYSPYGSHIINSFCHAWSCTPTYLLRKYYKKMAKE